MPPVLYNPKAKHSKPVNNKIRPQRAMSELHACEVVILITL
jgi:hypothetical protein